MQLFQIICPQAIIIRVAMGSAWTENTMDRMTTIATGINFAERVDFAEQKNISDHQIRGSRRDFSGSSVQSTVA